mgnify:FL=1
MKTTITTVQDVLNNSEYLFFFDKYYERPDYENKLYARTVLMLSKLPSELKEEIKKYVKENGVRFFTANDDDEGYPENHPEYDEEYCEDRCYGYYLDTDSNKNIDFQPLDRFTTPDLGHTGLYAKNSEGEYKGI